MVIVANNPLIFMLRMVIGNGASIGAQPQAFTRVFFIGAYPLYSSGGVFLCLLQSHGKDVRAGYRRSNLSRDRGAERCGVGCAGKQAYETARQDLQAL